MDTSPATSSAAQACEPASTPCVITHMQQFANLHDYATLHAKDGAKISARVHDFVLILDHADKHIELLAGFLLTHPHVSVHVRRLTLQGPSPQEQVCVGSCPLARILESASSLTDLILRHLRYTVTSHGFTPQPNLHTLVLDNVSSTMDTIPADILALTRQWRSVSLIDLSTDGPPSWLKHTVAATKIEKLVVSFHHAALDSTMQAPNFLSPFGHVTHLSLQNLSERHAAGLSALIAGTATHLVSCYIGQTSLAFVTDRSAWDLTPLRRCNSLRYFAIFIILEPPQISVPNVIPNLEASHVHLLTHFLTQLPDNCEHICVFFSVGEMSTLDQSIVLLQGVDWSRIAAHVHSIRSIRSVRFRTTSGPNDQLQALATVVSNVVYQWFSFFPYRRDSFDRRAMLFARFAEDTEGSF